MLTPQGPLCSATHFYIPLCFFQHFDLIINSRRGPHPGGLSIHPAASLPPAGRHFFPGGVLHHGWLVPRTLCQWTGMAQAACLPSLPHRDWLLLSPSISVTPSVYVAFHSSLLMSCKVIQVTVPPSLRTVGTSLLPFTPLMSAPTHLQALSPGPQGFACMRPSAHTTLTLGGCVAWCSFPSASAQLSLP